MGTSYCVEMREPTDRWRGHQPPAERLVYLPPKGFGLIVQAPNGDRVVIRLGPER
jgi:hypothetical protein